MTTSWPASAAAGSRHALTAVHSVPAESSGPASAAGRASSTEQAPHSPSLQPSLAPVRPRPRNQARAEVYAGVPASGRSVPLTVAVGVSMDPFPARGGAPRGSRGRRRPRRRAGGAAGQQGRWPWATRPRTQAVRWTRRRTSSGCRSSTVTTSGQASHRRMGRRWSRGEPTSPVTRATSTPAPTAGRASAGRARSPGARVSDARGDPGSPRGSGSPPGSATCPVHR